jgi:hypothetical protein
MEDVEGSDVGRPAQSSDPGGEVATSPNNSWRTGLRNPCALPYQAAIPLSKLLDSSAAESFPGFTTDGSNQRVADLYPMATRALP